MATRDDGIHPLPLLAMVVAILSIVLLGRAMLEASPLVFFGSTDERAELEAARSALPWTVIPLLAAAAVFALRGHPRHGALVALPAIVGPRGCCSCPTARPA